MKRAIGYATALLWIGLGAVPAVWAQQQDIFLDIPDVVGESVDAQHVGGIDVLSWSWSLNNPSFSSGRTLPTEVRDIKVVKNIDSATDDLLLAALTQKPFATAVLTMRASGPSPYDRLVLNLTNVVVSKVASGLDANALPVETIALHFDTVCATYTPTDNAGQPQAPQQICWNVVTNQSQ